MQDPAVSLRSLNFGGDSHADCPPSQNFGGDSPSLSPHDLRYTDSDFRLKGINLIGPILVCNVKFFVGGEKVYSQTGWGSPPPSASATVTILIQKILRKTRQIHAAFRRGVEALSDGEYAPALSFLPPILTHQE